MHDESIWIVRAKEGSEKAYRSLYDRHVTPLFRFLQQFTAEEAQVEDWVQRAFIKAFLNLATFDGRARFSTWLFTLAINEMRMDWRRQQVVAFVPLDEDLDAAGADEEPFDWNQLMKEWTNELDATKRAVFILYEVEGYSHSEIGSMLGIAESSSRTLLTRAKRHLQDRWNKEHKR